MLPSVLRWDSRLLLLLGVVLLYEVKAELLLGGLYNELSMSLLIS